MVLICDTAFRRTPVLSYLYTRTMTEPSVVQPSCSTRYLPKPLILRRLSSNPSANSGARKSGPRGQGRALYGCSLPTVKRVSAALQCNVRSAGPDPLRYCRITDFPRSPASTLQPRQRLPPLRPQQQPQALLPVPLQPLPPGLQPQPRLHSRLRQPSILHRAP